MKKILIIFALFISATLAAQTKIDLSQSEFFAGLNENPAKSGKVNLFEDDRLQKLVQKHIDLNNQSKGIPGWRVQIYFGSGKQARDKAQDARTTFLKLYPSIKSYIIYQAPYFKVRVGDFRSKFEALKLKKQITTQFESTWVVEDLISFQ